MGTETLEAISAVRGTPRILLRLEGLAALIAAMIAYRMLGGGWGWFAALFLLPDLSMLGYLAGARIGSICYNAAHSYLGAALLSAVAYTAHSPLAWQLAAIWCAHVGFDRALGYGLKYATAFTDTHLGRIGRAARVA
jgi:hypothetical protein